VTRIHFANRRAVGVEFQKKGELHTAAQENHPLRGAFNSPQLLQLSGVGRERCSSGTAFRSCTSCPASARICRTLYVRTFWRCRKAITLNDDMMSLRRMAIMGLRYSCSSKDPDGKRRHAARSSAPAGLQRPDAQLYFINFSTAKRGGVLHGTPASPAPSRSSGRLAGSVHIRCGDPAAAPLSVQLSRDRERPPSHDRGLKLLRASSTRPMRDYVRAEYLPVRE